ncbi:MAG: hypothetical protein ACKKMV_02595 [Candidatus Nealsonbacteria bacterium]
MNKAKQVQRQHEKVVCDRFIVLYNTQYGFNRFGNDQDEPDCIYKSKSEILGIEVASVYYRNIDAKQEWTVVRGERKPSKIEPSWGDVIRNPDDLMCQRIQQEITDKCNKQYRGASRFILCIEERAALSDEKSIKRCISQLRVPEQHIFSEIYLLHLAPLHEGGGDKNFRIYPK